MAKPASTHGRKARSCRHRFSRSSAALSQTAAKGQKPRRRQDLRGSGLSALDLLTADIAGAIITLDQTLAIAERLRLDQQFRPEGDRQSTRYLMCVAFGVALASGHAEEYAPGMSETPQESDGRWSDALLARDTVAVLPFMDDDFNLVVLFPTLARITRPEWLARLPDYVISAWVTKVSEWDVNDDLAIHEHLVDQTAIVLGVDRSGPFAITDVWRRSGGSWRVWRRVSTPLSSGEIPRISSVDKI